MLSSDQFDEEIIRAKIVLFSMLILFAFLGVVLWRVQVVGHTGYNEDIEKQSMRRVRLPGLRGAIYDRNGVRLADNKPSYCIAIYVEELRQSGREQRTIDKISEVIDQLSDVLLLEREVTARDIAIHISKRRPIPFLAWKNVDDAALARLAESNRAFPGVAIEVRSVRVYPNDKLASHILGYVGRMRDKQDKKEKYRFFMPDMEGKYGVERVFNEALSGSPGVSLICVDASGFRYEEVEEQKKEPKAGNNIILAIDSRIQKIAEKALKGERGSVIVLDPVNGDVLALANAPAFNPNSVRYKAAWDKMRADGSKPLVNRAISKVYPPGSIFKPVVSIAALENGRANGDTVFDCPGYFELGKSRFRCWNKDPGHGKVTMRKALEQSCNPYFCQLGLLCEYDRIYHMAEALGIGKRTGVELVDLMGGESRGFMGNNSWKERRYNDKWRPGDTCNVSIGQGLLSVTPMQMAVVASAIANGGKVFRPRIVLPHQKSSRQSEDNLVIDLDWSKETMSVVRGGMFDVVQSDSGTGKRARISGINMAGKTGTAQYGVKGEKQHTWMIGYAPFEDPQYAVVILIENGISGGISAAPRLKILMEGIFDLDATAEETES